jgi:membrane associated rhomboid family serine protease
MGFQDRDYVRRGGPSYLGSWLERGRICKWLVGINVVIFFIQLATRGGYSEDGAFDAGAFTNFLDLNVYEVVFHGQIWRLITHMFLHDVTSPAHIIFNMLFLWWFGSDVEDLYGPREFVAIYLVGGLASAVAFVATSLPLALQVTDAALSPVALGASGAVTAVLLIFACHYPTRIIYVFFFLPVPIWLFVLFTVLHDAFIFVGQMNTGVAVAGHLGGAAFGFLYYKLHWRLSGLWPSFTTWRKRRSQPRLRVYREEEAPTPVSVVAANPPASPALEDEHLEAKMDAVLEKISREGKDNLTESEKAILLKASEILRKRRT